MWGKRKSAQDEQEPLANAAPPAADAPPPIEKASSPQPQAGSAAKAELNGVRSTAANGTDRKNGATGWNDGKDTATQSTQEPRGPTADEIRFSVTFTRIVSILTRSPHYKHYSLSDLEWLVVPPILTGQCAVMEANVNGRQLPVAAALWASVSEEVDRRLSENLTTPIKLRPDEWRSGELLWLIDAVGDAKAIPHLLKQVQETAFKEKKARVRTLDAHSRLAVGLLNHGSVQS